MPVFYTFSLSLQLFIHLTSYIFDWSLVIIFVFHSVINYLIYIVMAKITNRDVVQSYVFTTADMISLFEKRALYRIIELFNHIQIV